MGQAALDLPDPLQSPPQDAATTSTDDLLAQLAGDEIDRLLAEADGFAPRAAAAPFHVGPSATPEPEVAAEPSAAARPNVPEPVAPVAEPGPSPVEQEVAAELDALFSAAVEKDKARERAEADLAAADGTSTAERAGLTAPAAAAPAADSGSDEPGLPLYLRPLEWLSAPLAIFPPAVRDLIGKAAIVTLLNATAILVYVLIVRRG